MHDKVFNNLKEIQQEMLKILSEVSSLTQYPIRVDHNNLNNKWNPKCDIFAIDNKLFIVFEISGIDKNDLAYSVNNDYLKIHGKRYCEYQSKKVSFYNMEIETGEFERKVNFPDLKIDIENFKVKYEEGFLKFIFNIIEIQEKIIHIKID